MYVIYLKWNIHVILICVDQNNILNTIIRHLNIQYYKKQILATLFPTSKYCMHL